MASARDGLIEALNIAHAVNVLVQADAAKARDARLHARDANGFDSVPYHDGRSDGVEQVIRALMEAIERANDA